MAAKLLYLKGLALILRDLIGLVKERAVFVDLPFVFGQRISSVRELIFDIETS